MLAELQGQIERITYKNEENGYTIARVKVYGNRDLVTVVGNLISASPGEILSMTGEWLNHPKFGEQFKIVQYKTKIPATVYGIEKYLGSGLVRGIGPGMAKRIVRHFGKDTLEVIESNATRLSEVDGIGRKRVEMIRLAWEEQKEIRDVMLFLQGHGVSTGYAVKIFKLYGNDSIQQVKENPYRLATDIFGIGFITADKIAESMGVPRDSQQRAQAGLLYVLHQLADEGHVYSPYEVLVNKSMEMLSVERDLVTIAIATLFSERRIIIEDVKDNDASIENCKAVYLAKYYLCEVNIAGRLWAILTEKKNIREFDVEKALSWVKANLSIDLDGKQISAVKLALEKKLLLITGGPGTGKTTIINAILKIYSRLGAEILLCAPTGRAAKRMEETTGYKAKTIHRLLEYGVKQAGFQKNDHNPLICDVLIVDESSMIDTILMHHLLKAVPLKATVIFVGDVNQLPSVGAGNVLKDMIESRKIPLVILDRIFRQAQSSRIIVAAHEINRGFIPNFKTDERESDCYFIQKEEPEAVVSTILELACHRIPKKFGFDPVEAIQVLTPMHRGVAGAGSLNMALQEKLNSHGQGIERGNRVFRVNDKVMQIRNNYEKEVFNGDIGKIVSIDREDQIVSVLYDGRIIGYEFSDLDELMLAYAISVHKSQGSEYPCVILPVLTQHYVLLQRNLLYTAITRGKGLVVMVGTRKALAIAIKNDTPERRFTYLKHRINAALQVL